MFSSRAQHYFLGSIADMVLVLDNNEFYVQETASPLADEEILPRPPQTRIIEMFALQYESVPVKEF